MGCVEGIECSGGVDWNGRGVVVKSIVRDLGHDRMFSWWKQ